MRLVSKATDRATKQEISIEFFLMVWKHMEIEILLVEDNPGDAELAIRALKRYNLANNLVHLENGAEALDYIFAEGVHTHRNTENLPGVILLDLNIPKVSGLEVLQRVKGDERTCNVPIIVLTSSKQDPDIQRCHSLGANSYMIKPVEFDKFAKAIKNLSLYWMLLDQRPA
jgi:two-component system response regulator